VNRRNAVNLGDRLIGRVLCSALKDKGIDVRNVEYTGNKDNIFVQTICRVLSKIGLSPISSFIGVIFYVPKIIREKLDSVIIGGGQLLLPNRSFLFSLLGWYVVCKLINIEYVLFSVGTEKRSNSFSNIESRILSICINGASCIFLRDRYSQDLIYDITGSVFEVSPDVVYLLKHSKYKHSVQKGIYVCPADFDKQAKIYSMHDSRIEYWRSFETKIRNRLCSRENIYLFSTSTHDYQEIYKMHRYLQKQFENNIEVIHIDTVESLLSIMGRARVVVSSRMHPVIIAHIMGSKAYAVYSNNKIKSFANSHLKKDTYILSQEVNDKLLACIGSSE
jgi:polysaccharide pyruvyl transferase WcaK-like protein